MDKKRGFNPDNTHPELLAAVEKFDADMKAAAERHEKALQEINDNAEKKKKTIRVATERKKMAISIAGDQLRAEMRELFKNPERNRESIDNFSLRVKERLEQAKNDPDSFLVDVKLEPSSRYLTQQHVDVSAAETPNNQGREEKSNSRLTITKFGGYYQLSDTNGSSVSSLYKNIERIGGHFIAESTTGMYYLLDPETGRDLNGLYQKIELIDGAIIGYKGPRLKVLLDPNTGKELGAWYQGIEILDNQYVVGERTAGMCYLVDRKTGSELSSFYKKIYKKDNKIIGYNGFWEDVLRG